MASSLIMYVVLGFTGVVGSLIAWDDLRRSKGKSTAKPVVDSKS